jgi:hypothetical protein
MEYGNEPTNRFAAAPTAGRADTADSDLDGMPDDWETANGLNPNFSADADQDADSDGATNLAEFRAGTNPQSAQSVLKIASVQYLGATVQLRFLAVAGQAYQVQSRSDLSTGNWMTVSTVPAGATGEVTAIVPAAGPVGFYRVVVAGTP